MGAGMPWEATTSLTALLIFIVTICIIIRLRGDYIRHLPTTSGIICNILAIVAFLAYVGGFICSCIRGKRKVMTHAAADSLDDRKFIDVARPPEIWVMKLLVVELMLIPFSVWLTKASLLSTLYSVKSRAPPARRYWLNVIAIVILSCFLTVIFTYTFSCAPFSTQWSLDHSTFCSPILKIREQTIFTTLDMFSNITIVVGCFMIFNVEMLPRRDRLSVFYILLIAFFECAALLIRIAILAVTGVREMHPSTVNTVLFLSRVEIGAGLITTTWPTLRAIIDTALFCADVTMGSDGHSDFAKTIQGEREVSAGKIQGRWKGAWAVVVGWFGKVPRRKDDGNKEGDAERGCRGRSERTTMKGMGLEQEKELELDYDDEEGRLVDSKNNSSKRGSKRFSFLGREREEGKSLGVEMVRIATAPGEQGRNSDDDFRGSRGGPDDGASTIGGRTPARERSP